MKTVLISISLFLSIISFKSFKQGGTDKMPRIEFIHTGIDVKYISPLIISKSKLNIELNEIQEKEFHEMQSHGMSITKEGYINLMYDLIVTNDETYNFLLSFIQDHSEFYTNNVNTNNDSSENIAVATNDNTYYLFYKTQEDYFGKLVTFLKSKNCDKKVIDAIRNYK